jgi:hypothetical protein
MIANLHAGRYSPGAGGSTRGLPVKSGVRPPRGVELVTMLPSQLKVISRSGAQDFQRPLTRCVKVISG